MMRSLYSGVSGLKTHQTRMDVIGNNIANVNTTAYKSKSINFSDMLYQTTQSATAPNTDNNTAGTNPRQIGLGVKTGAISTSITTEGSTQSTGNPFDLKLTGEAFFVVSDGTNQYFTRDGSFNVDASGYLCMSSTGYTVQGWTTVDDDTGAIIQDSVKPIKVLSASNETYPAAYTTSASISGILDKDDDNLATENGKLVNVQILDNRGYEYNLKFGITPVDGTSERTVKNIETYYVLPTSLTASNTTEFGKYYVYDSEGNKLNQLVDTTTPQMVADIEMAAQKVINNNVTDRMGEDSDGNKYVIVDLVETVSQGSDYEVSAGKTLMSQGAKTLRVYYDDVVTYYNQASEFTIGDEALAALYTQNGATYTLNDSVNNATGIKIISKTYTVDGEEVTDYETYLSDKDGNAIGDKITSLTKYSDIVDLMSGGVTIGNYTTTEEVSAGDKEGSYTIKLINMTDSDGEEVTAVQDMDIAKNGLSLLYNTGNGNFISVGGEDSFTVDLASLGADFTNFSNVTIDMTNTSNVNNGGKSTVAGEREDGRKVGTLTGVSIGTDGVITANYDNGMQKSIAQISVATFANAMGLENAGDNLYSQTSNSGEFDGIGVDIKASGTGYMTTGVLEMSNVDLSTEFTNMITTQRGFQANSRIITTSDTLLEELVNLKR